MHMMWGGAGRSAIIRDHPQLSATRIEPRIDDAPLCFQVTVSNREAAAPLPTTIARTNAISAKSTAAELIIYVLARPWSLPGKSIRDWIISVGAVPPVDA
jgi:hypothetical protein